MTGERDLDTNSSSSSQLNLAKAVRHAATTSNYVQLSKSTGQYYVGRRQLDKHSPPQKNMTKRAGVVGTMDTLPTTVGRTCVVDAGLVVEWAAPHAVSEERGTLAVECWLVGRRIRCMTSFCRAPNRSAHPKPRTSLTACLLRGACLKSCNIF